MLSDAISYINSHRQIFILIIVVLLVITIILYFSCNSCSENFGATEAPESLINNKNVTLPFPVSEEYIKIPNYPIQNDDTDIDFIKNQSIVRFRTTIHGNNYYLMIVPISKCSVITQTDKTMGCLNNTIALVDEKTVLQNISEYLDNLKDKGKVCNYQQYLQCKRSLSKTSKLLNNSSHLVISSEQNMPTQTTFMPEQESESDTKMGMRCATNNPKCNLKQQYPIDFRIEKHITSLGKKKYAVRGIDGNLNMDIGVSQYYLNLNMRAPIKNDTVVGTLCADSKEADNKKSNVLMDLMLTKILTNSMVETETPRYKAKIRISIETTPAQFDEYGKQIRRHFFLGVCKSNICKVSDTTYARACLFTDLLDQNVLEFEPIVIKYDDSYYASHLECNA